MVNGLVNGKITRDDRENRQADMYDYQHSQSGRFYFHVQTGVPIRCV
jgi:hypothetical protein